MTVFDTHEKLQKKFADLYCAKWIVDSIEGDIVKYIQSKLGECISDKIESIGVDLDYDNFIVLSIFVPNSHREEIFEKLNYRGLWKPWISRIFSRNPLV